MTLLEIVNQVMKRLREDAVASTASTAYSELVTEFVSEIHQEVALAHDWSIGYQEIEFDLVDGQEEYNLSAVTSGGGDVTIGSQVTTSAYDQPQFRGMVAMYADNTTDQPVAYLSYVPIDRYMAEKNKDRDASMDPCYITLQARSEGGWNAKVYPVPSASSAGKTIRLPFHLSEPLLASDGSDDNTVIRIPTRPIYLGALFLALNERGEEIGEPGNIAEARYYRSLGAAVEADVKLREMTDRYDWYRG